MKEKISKYFYISVFIVLALNIAGCKDSDLVGTSYATFTGQMVGQYLEDSLQFSDFTAALKKANAFSLLKTYGKYTCFIPTNAAMQAYYSGKGKTLDQLDSTELKDLVYYHLIDGESAGTQTYKTSDYTSFGKGALPTKNMVGRYIYTSLSAGTWMVNKTSKILSPDNEMINGVVHVIDKVLEGNKDLLPDYIATNSRFSIFSQALQLTQWATALRQTEDLSYVQPSAYLYDRQGSVNHYIATCPAPKKRLLGYTLFMESDSVMAQEKYNIHSLDDLKKYAKSVYGDKGYEADYSNKENSLNKFIAYHIVNKKMTTDNIVTKFGYTYCWSSEYSSSSIKWFAFSNADDKYELEQYLIPMCPNTLIAVQLGNYFNVTDPDTDEEASVLNAKFNHKITETDKSKFTTLIDAESNNECVNGIYHSLNNMLIYNNKVESKVLHKRLRMEFRTFLPELINNDVNFEKYTSGIGTQIPSGYCANMTYNQDSKVSVILFPANVHAYLYGDEMLADGFFNVKIKVGPVPAGKYEIRIGYQSRLGTRAITQYYFDGTPCGIPLNQNLNGDDPLIGWEQVYNDDQKVGGSGGNIDDPEGFEKDKDMRNRGYMRGPDSFTEKNYYNGTNGVNVYYTARNDKESLRRILGIFSFDETTTHTFSVVAMTNGDCLLDYIEFIPVDLIPTEDIH